MNFGRKVRRQLLCARANWEEQNHRDRVLNGTRILMYHAVGTPLSYNTYGISISPARFREHVAFLSQWMRQSTTRQWISFSEIDTSTNAKEFRLAFTFDDGYADNLLVAAPILAEFAIPFTVFVVARDIQTGRAPFLNENQLRELAQMPGATIGAHGWSHARLDECDEATLHRELRDSRDYLQQTLQKSVVTLSYPHGATDARVRAAAHDAGYAVGGCSAFGINSLGRDALLLKRCEVWADDDVKILRQKISGHWDWYGCRQIDLAQPQNA